MPRSPIDSAMLHTGFAIVVSATVLPLLLLLAGCSSVEVPEDRFFRLTAAQRDAPSLQPALTTLVVERFEVEGLTAQRPIVHTQRGAAHQLRQYVYAFWADSPSRLLQDVTVDALRTASVAERVVTPALRLNAEYRLAGRIRQLEHVRGEPGAARVALEFSLTRTSDGKLLLLEQSSREVPVEARGIGPVIVAMNRALNDIYDRLIRRLAGLEVQIADGG